LLHLKFRLGTNKLNKPKWFIAVNKPKNLKPNKSVKKVRQLQMAHCNWDYLPTSIFLLSLEICHVQAYQTQYFNVICNFFISMFMTCGCTCNKEDFPGY